MTSFRGILGQSDTPTSPRAILLHTDQFSILFCTRLYVFYIFTTGVDLVELSKARIGTAKAKLEPKF